MSTPSDPFVPLDVASIAARTQFDAYVAAGFTDDQALYLVGVHVAVIGRMELEIQASQEYGLELFDTGGGMPDPRAMVQRMAERMRQDRAEEIRQHPAHEQERRSGRSQIEEDNAAARASGFVRGEGCPDPECRTPGACRMVGACRIRLGVVRQMGNEPSPFRCFICGGPTFDTGNTLECPDHPMPPSTTLGTLPDVSRPTRPVETWVLSCGCEIPYGDRAADVAGSVADCPNHGDVRLIARRVK